MLIDLFLTTYLNKIIAPLFIRDNEIETKTHNNYFVPKHYYY